MAFGRQQPSADEISQEIFGMSAADVKAKLSKLDEVENTVKSVKDLATAQSTTLGEISTKLGELSTPYSRQDSTQQQQQQQTPELAKWDEDAEAAYQQRQRPVIAAVLDTRGMIAKREAMDEINAKNPDLPWHMFSDEIEKKIKDAPLESKASPIFWKNVYHACVGEKRQEIERDKQAKKGNFYIETGTSSIVIDKEQDKKPEDKLNQDQLNAARKTGLTPAQYVAQLDTMQVWR